MAFLCTSPLANNSIASDNTETEYTAHVYFSLADEFGGASKQPSKEFDCTDKVFTVVELQHYPAGRYTLSVKWNNPQGDVQEQTQYPFYVKKTEVRLWAWLSLIRATGAGMLQWLNPAAGLEEFIGEWQVDVYIDDVRIATDQFQVIC